MTAMIADPFSGPTTAQQRVGKRQRPVCESGSDGGSNRDSGAPVPCTKRVHAGGPARRAPPAVQGAKAATGAVLPKPMAQCQSPGRKKVCLTSSKTCLTISWLWPAEVPCIV